MLTFIKGDIFSSDCQTIVNAVNCVGVMGAGIALEYKKRFPLMFTSYKTLCDNNLLEPGKLHLHKVDDQRSPVRDQAARQRWILNFPTKLDWRNPTKMEYLELGFKKFKETYKEKGITSIAFPHLGCQNGGLDFETQVKPLMIKMLSDIDIDIKVYEYVIS